MMGLVKRHGHKRWAQVSEDMKGNFGENSRSGKQCRERWHNHLNPKVKKRSWTVEEES